MKRGLLALATVLIFAAVVGPPMTASQQPGTAGGSVWDGVYAEQQAARGAVAYSANCSRCHGGQLEGNNGKPLVGEVFWRDFQARTVDYLLTYMSRNMPNGAAGSLPGDVYLDLTAFILRQNEFPTGRELTAESAVGVQIIPKGGTSELPASALGRVVGCLANTGPGGWRVNRATAAERADGKIVPEDATRALGTRSFPMLFVITPLDKLVGHRVVVTGILMGQGGADGINVTQVDSLRDTCQ